MFESNYEKGIGKHTQCQYCYTDFPEKSCSICPFFKKDKLKIRRFKFMEDVRDWIDP